MSSFLNTLRYGSIPEVIEIVDGGELREEHVRAALLNILERMARLEYETDTISGETK